MVGERLRYTIEAKDDTAAAAESVEGRFGGTFSRLAGAAAAVGVALVTAVANAAEEVELRLQRLRIATGGGGEDAQALLADLGQAGLDEGPAIDAVAALQGQAALLGVDPLDRRVAQSLGGVATVGADPRFAAQALAQFGVRGSQDVTASLELATAQSLGANVDPGDLYTALRSYGPVLAAFGLNFLESAALVVDLSQQGIDVSRVSPALNRFIRDASAAGESPRLAGARAFQDIRDATPVDAAAIGQEYFGAEGGLRLTAAIRSGRVGLGQELALDPNILDSLSLAGVGAPTTRQRVDRFLDATRADPSQPTTARFAAGGLAELTDLPVVGGPLSSLLGQGLLPDREARDAGDQRVGELTGLAAAIEKQNELLAEQIRLQQVGIGATNTVADAVAAISRFNVGRSGFQTLGSYLQSQQDRAGGG